MRPVRLPKLLLTTLLMRLKTQRIPLKKWLTKPPSNSLFGIMERAAPRGGPFLFGDGCFVLRPSALAASALVLRNVAAFAARSRA